MRQVYKARTHLEENCGSSFAKKQSPVKHLSHVIYAGFVERGFVICSLRGCYALGVRASRGVRTVGERARNCAGLRPDLQSVLTQWWNDSPIRYKPQKIRFPQSRLVCRGKQIWRYDSHTGAATAPPRSYRIEPQNQYTPVATNTIVLSSRASRGWHAHPSSPCRQTTHA